MTEKYELFQPGIKDIVKELKKDALSVKNRLQSVIYDHHQVQSLCAKWSLSTVVANERCGLWYVAPEEYIDTCYFKSTDGHTHQWAFSQRRLNLHLLETISKETNITIVDSTKRGKLMPDALSKTIPIWCAVLNSIYFDKEEVDDSLRLFQKNNWLLTPSEMVGDSETRQIQQLIPLFARQVASKGLITKEMLETILGTGDQRKPLLCQWYYPGCLGMRNPLDIDASQLHIISCVIASKKVNDMENRMTLRLNGSVVQWYYVQGSADDHELWLTNEICEGKLDPRFFWNHIYTSSDIIDPNSNMIYDWLGDDQLIAKMNNIWTNYAQLLSTKNGILPDISNVDKEDSKTGISFGIINSSVEYAELVDAFKSNVDQVIVFSTKYEILNPRKAKVFHYSLESGKKSSRQLRDIFPVLIPQLDTNMPIMVLGEDDTDLAALVVLILLSQNYDDDWCRCQPQQRPNKDTVRRHLRLLLNVRRVNPSRNTLQSVNAYIM